MMNSHWYNTKDGITHQAKTLHGLDDMFNERRKAGYERKEKLDIFIVRGRWHMDTCGNVSKIINHYGDSLIPGEKYPDIPLCLTEAEFWQFLKDKGEVNPSVGWTFKADVMRDGIVCPQCQKEWTIDDCHNVTVINDDEVFSADEMNFTGKQLWEVTRMFERDRNDAEFWFHPEIMVQNRRFIDLRPTESSKGTDSEYPRNKTGWVGSREGLTEWYVLQAEDQFRFETTRYYHPECYKAKITAEEQATLLKCFVDAKMDPTGPVETTPNEYWLIPTAAPWFLVPTRLGTFKVGWRKRVINLEWPKGQNYQDLFKDEKVTLWKSGVHCWGYEKLEQYLRRINLKTAPVLKG